MVPHWIKADYDRLEHANDFADLLPIALDIVRRIPAPVSIVCGPISTGGLGSIEKNLAAFERAIEKLAASGRNVFSQAPFETPMQRIKLMKHGDAYPTELLTDFYQPLFESGLIHEFHFLPGWETSRGANWEHDQAKRLGIDIFYLPERWAADD